MKKNSQIVVGVLAFLIAGALITNAYVLNHAKKTAFQTLQATVAGYAATSATRVGKAVITLPDNSTLVTLVNGTAQYILPTSIAQGAITVSLDKEATEFISGAEGTTNLPRLDVAVPMFVSLDNNPGGSTYVVLFNDRGDAAIEKSYARLGGPDISVTHISMLPADVPGYEYRVDIDYTQQGQDASSGQMVSNTKEVIIPVLDGQFDPKGTVDIK